MADAAEHKEREAAASTWSRPVRYLAIVLPNPASKEPRHRDLETTADLAIGHELFLDEQALRVAEVIPPPTDDPGGYAGTIVCTPTSSPRRIDARNPAAPHLHQ
jgi:hypothetical protein